MISVYPSPIVIALNIFIIGRDLYYLIRKLLALKSKLEPIGIAIDANSLDYLNKYWNSIKTIIVIIVLISAILGNFISISEALKLLCYSPQKLIKIHKY